MLPEGQTHMRLCAVSKAEGTAAASTVFVLPKLLLTARMLNARLELHGGNSAESALETYSAVQ